MGTWDNGPVSFYFNNDTIWFLVIHRPRKHLLDVYKFEDGKKGKKYITSYSDNVSEWTVKHWIMEENPGLIDTDEEEDEEETEAPVRSEPHYHTILTSATKEIRKQGNSLVIMLTKELKALGYEEGDLVTVLIVPKGQNPPTWGP